MTTIRMANGNCVAALQPSPGDLFVVTLLAGKVVFVQPADDYEKALRLAEAFADRMPPPGRPFTVKVFGMSLPELVKFQGTTIEEIAASLPAASRDDDWKLAISTCQSALRDCDDAATRRDAYDILVQMGAMQP